MGNRQNQKERLEMKRNAILASGLVSDRLPGVASIVFHMSYHQKTSDPAIMTRMVNFVPTDYACFHMDCLREECTNGGFDLAPVVAGLVKQRKTSGKGNLYCRGKNKSLRFGHASIAYEIKIQYRK